MNSDLETKIGDDIALQDALEREAATREILQVISHSRDDEKPVFDAILENAARLCDAPMASLNLLDEKDTRLVLRAHWGGVLDHFETGATEWPLDGSSAPAVAVRECRIVHIEDLAQTEAYKLGDPIRVKSVDKEGIRTFLAVPLMRGGAAIGCIALFRRETKLFDERHVDLVKAFATQAVIAIENVRQFRELQARLESEVATREILQVINRSRDDEKPVFDAILESAGRLCEAPFGFLFLTVDNGRQLELRANRGGRAGFTEMVMKTPLSVDPTQSDTARSLHERSVYQIEDVSAEQLYIDRQPHRVLAVDVEGMRTALYVPLISGDEGLGVITLYRREVRLFSQSHVDLVRTFAEQAVIAIENVRQFKALAESNASVRAQAEELQTLNTNLESRVEEQVGEIERMGRLKRFLSPAVADAVVSAGDDRLLSSHRALIAILFCDIRGFTAFCEMAEPEETIEILQTYHEEMGALISAHGAGVDHRSGDGIMVIFNDPLPCDDPAGQAVEMALAMRTRMVELSADWRKLGHRLGFGVGVSLGYATVGMVGSAGRYDYTASGTAVNLAARLCDHANDGEILLSPRAYRAIEGSVIAEPAGEFSLKGIQAPVEVMRVIRSNDPKGPVTSE